MSDMNITPLVDVMLVLLIIFMVTMPLRTASIGIDLPQVNPNPLPTPAAPIDVKIDADGRITWNGTAMPVSALRATMNVEAERYPDPLKQPVIRVDTDQNAQYAALVAVLAASKDSGLARIGFVDHGQR
jgi:biopolymer transport protein ExbD